MNSNNMAHRQILMNENGSDFDLLCDSTCHNITRNGQITEQHEEILVEHVIDVYVNEQLTMKLICIPQHLPELVLGRLFTEGIIAGIHDVKSIYICESGRRARVYLNDGITYSRQRNYVEITPTCCTGNRIFHDYFVNHQEAAPVQPIPWKSSWIFQLADKFANGMPLHSKTWSTHSCLLAQEDRLLFQCEDIGRHNALDKAIGYALLQNIDLRQCIVYSSGRIPTDMVMKAIRAGIPILSSKGMPTKEAIELAGEYRLTLICAARKDRMKLYTGTQPA